MKITVLIPARNEAENLPGLLDEVAAALAERDYEVIVVDDGSDDDTAEVLAKMAAAAPYQLRHIRHATPTGKSFALRSGVYAARGDVVATLDGDGQNNPVNLVELTDALLAAGPDIGLAAGRRLGRTDSAGKQWASRMANGLRRRLLDDDALDSGCGLKVMRTELFRALPFFEGCHRFLPALVRQEGYRTINVDVVDRPRQHGTSHYGILDRGLRGWIDLLGVYWLRRRRSKVPRPEEVTHD